MNRDRGRFLLLLAVVAVVGPLLALLLSNPSRSTPEPLPNPNGFDDFVAAGEGVHGDSDFAKLDFRSLRELAAKNREPLQRARIGLTRDSLVPNNYSPNYINHLTVPLMNLKSLAWAFCAEGRLAELESRTNDAVKIYLDDIRLGQKCSHRGVIIVRLVGTAIEIIGMNALGTLTNIQDSSLCREVVRSLTTLDQTEDSSQTTFREEARWRRQSFGLMGEVRHIWEYKSAKTENELLLTRLEETKRQRRNLMISFAARAYELENGHSPGIISKLVPDYLKAVPHDPQTGKPMTQP